jgi:pyridoxal phosphate enzyme (YggS family)
VQSIESNLEALNERITQACRNADRPREDVTLIAVSKTKPSSQVRAAAKLGITHFGENYLDEAVNKIADTADLQLTWHFIGRIQSNKTRIIAEQFDWVHTVDRSKIAQRLNAQCPAAKQLNVLIQINIDDDPAKGGVNPAQAQPLIEEIVALPALRLRGLMTILSQQADPGVSYQSMTQLSAQLGKQLSPADQQDWGTLSMGMTADLDAAIVAGATHIRIGTALFGARNV